MLKGLQPISKHYAGREATVPLVRWCIQVQWRKIGLQAYLGKARQICMIRMVLREARVDAPQYGAISGVGLYILPRMSDGFAGGRVRRTGAQHGAVSGGGTDCRACISCQECRMVLQEAGVDAPEHTTALALQISRGGTDVRQQVSINLGRHRCPLHLQPSLWQDARHSCMDMDHLYSVVAIPARRSKVTASQAGTAGWNIAILDLGFVGVLVGHRPSGSWIRRSPRISKIRDFINKSSFSLNFSAEILRVGVDCYIAQCVQSA